MKRKFAAVFLAAALVVSGSSMAWAAEGEEDAGQINMEKETKTDATGEASVMPLIESDEAATKENGGTNEATVEEGTAEKEVPTAKEATPNTEAAAEEPVNPDLGTGVITGTDSNGLTWTVADGVATISGSGRTGIAPFKSDGEIKNSITSVVIEDGVTEIGVFTFRDWINLREVSISESVVRIGNISFEGCGLVSIDIPGSVTEIGGRAFAGCSNLSEVTLPDSVKVIGWGAFDGCSELTEVTIPNGVTVIERETFNNCISLKDITIPDSVENIDDKAFNNCGSLSGVVIPNKVTTIAYRAFSNCRSLPNVTVPASLKQIGHGAFAECTGLQEVTFEGDAPEIGGDIHKSLEPFQDVTATAQFPQDNKTWDYKIADALGRKLQWMGIERPKVPSSPKTPSASDKVKALRIIPEATDNEYVIGSEEGATIKCTGELKDFVSVYVDGREVDRSNYTLKEGSTVLTFLTKYLDTLSVGKHKVTMNYTYGSVDTELNVLAKTGGSATVPGASSGISGSNGSGGTNGNATGVNRAGTSGNAASPKTGDQTTGLLWMLIAVLAAGSGAVVVAKKRAAA